MLYMRQECVAHPLKGTSSLATEQVSLAQCWSWPSGLSSQCCLLCCHLMKRMAHAWVNIPALGGVTPRYTNWGYFVNLRSSEYTIAGQLRGKYIIVEAALIVRDKKYIVALR